VNHDESPAAIDTPEARTIDLGDGITARIRPDGVIRIRAANHSLSVEWLTNKPQAGDNSVLGIRLERK
jgi:hypothetical protein